MPHDLVSRWLAVTTLYRLVGTAGVLVMMASLAVAQTNPAPQFQTFVKEQARVLRADDKAPVSMAEWKDDESRLRAQLLKAWGGFPETPCDLEPRSFGNLVRDGYSIEKLVFQTMPGIWMTANAYVPANATSKIPAVLCVHGHWPGAKQDPVVQARCIGLAKQGFFVLCVDAFGAGERAVKKTLGEYHGEMTGAMLLPIGRPLSGIQVYENMRAVDYLQTRAEVDPDRIGITGASGGGNQSMYAGAWDKRFRCVVPTCSVGNYQAYLSAACCMCEVVPGALRFTEEGDVLGLAADRGLMVTSATQDAFQFSVDQAKVSVGRANLIAQLFEPAGRATVRHTIIESPHHYNQPMREAMYGWMTLNLKGTGDGSPMAEPAIQTEDPETLQCFPGDSRPDDYVTLPRFAMAESTRLLQERRTGPDHKWLESLRQAETSEQKAAVQSSGATALVASLVASLGGLPEPAPLKLQSVKSDDGKSVELTFETEPGLEIFVRCDVLDPAAQSSKLALLINVDDGADRTFESARANELRGEGYRIAAPELRATGRLALAADKIGNAPDHNSAEWSLWIGRPLLGQFVWDIKRSLDAIESHQGTLPDTISIVGINSSGVIAFTAAALDHRLSHVTATDSLATFASDTPYRGQRLGLLVPGLLRDVGDIGHVAALIAPRELTIERGVNGAGDPLSLADLQTQYSITAEVYSAWNAKEKLQIRTGP